MKFYMKKKNRIWIFMLMIVSFISILFLIKSCKKPNEPFLKDLLTSRSWSLTADNSQLYPDEEYCVLAFRSDGSLLVYNFIKAYSSWQLTHDGEILTMDYDDYKILDLSENELLIKYNTDLGHTYKFKAITSIYKSTDGVSGLSKNSAVLNGTVRTNNSSADVYFEYGTSTLYGETIPATPGSITAKSKETVSALINGLEPETVYHYRIKVVVNSETTFGEDLTFRTFNSLTVNDADGNIYNTITIGTQTWMAENLKTTRYSNGDQIPNVPYFEDWRNLNSGASCENTNISDFYSTYGLYYNWYAVQDNRNICPVGWHVPTDEEWTTLTNLYTGGYLFAAIKLKEAGTTHWNSTNTAATNESGFTALPASFRPEGTGFINPGEQGRWWTGTEFDSNNAWDRLMGRNASYVNREETTKTIGLSVRCIKD
jgi:uncharacterized protein (TIGR02145 family)